MHCTVPREQRCEWFKPDTSMSYRSTATRSLYAEEEGKWNEMKWNDLVKCGL